MVMEELFGGPTVFHIIRTVVFWISPVIFLAGLFLMLTAERYAKMEEKLGREIGGIRKRVIPSLETNIYSFHQWLLEKNVMAGLFYIACAAAFFFLKGPNTA
jgi:hypothetical protein